MGNTTAGIGLTKRYTRWNLLVTENAGHHYFHLDYDKNKTWKVARSGLFHCWYWYPNEE